MVDTAEPVGRDRYTLAYVESMRRLGMYVPPEALSDALDEALEDVGNLASAIELHYDEHSMNRELENAGADPLGYMPDQAWKANRELWKTLGEEYT